MKQSLVQFPCGFAIFCRSVFTCIFDALKSIGALQDDIYILVHPGLRVGGWECSVGQAAPTHPPFAVDLSKCFCLCLVCFESRRQPLRLGKAWDSLVLKQLRVFTGSLEEDLVFHRRSARYLRDFGSR